MMKNDLHLPASMDLSGKAIQAIYSVKKPKNISILGTDMSNQILGGSIPKKYKKKMVPLLIPRVADKLPSIERNRNGSNDNMKLPEIRGGP